MCPHTSGCELMLKNISSFVLYNQRFGRSVQMFRNCSYKHNEMWKCVLNVLVKYGLKTLKFIQWLGKNVWIGGSSQAICL